MARGRKRKEVVEKTLKQKASELKLAISDASRHKADAASHSGMHGQAVKLFCERTSFDRTVFGWLRKLHDLGDEMKRQSIIRQFLMGVDLLGFANQGDLFDDVKEEIANKVERDDIEEGDEDADARLQQDNSPADPDAKAAAEAGIPPLKQDGVPLAEAEKVFKRNVRKAPDPLLALAGEGAAVN